MCKILSVALLGICVLLFGCKKERLSENDNSSIVEITVCNSKGELLENQLGKMYVEATYETFKDKLTT